MDYELLPEFGVRIDWFWNRIATLADVRPRFIGAPCSFEFFSTDNPEDYSSQIVWGKFEGCVGDEILVSGDMYPYSRVSNLKIWRKGIKR